MSKLLYTAPNFQLFEEEPMTIDLYGNQVSLNASEIKEKPQNELDNYKTEIDDLIKKGYNIDKINKAIDFSEIEEKDTLKSYVSDLISPVKERFGAIKESIQQRSFEPLQKSLSKQWQQTLSKAGTPESIMNMSIGATEPLKAFKGLPNLSTKLLEQFRGMPEKIKSGRFEEIINLAKKFGIKEVDENLVRSSVVKDKFGMIDLPKTAAKVEEKLVPLTPTPVKSPRWSHIGEEFIGDGKYGEIVYQSPIKTSAGDVHFSSKEYPSTFNSYDAVRASRDSFPNYFSHIRYEDLADGKGVKLLEDQSDLFQKGNFERSTVKMFGGIQDKARKSEIQKLLTYNSNDPLAHLRTFREFIKLKAQQGKTYMLTPSGETAMKIEGLGSREAFQMENGRLLSSETVKIGRKVLRAEDSNEWIITDVLGEGKFKAVPKSVADEAKQLKKDISRYGEEYIETFDISGKVDTKHFVYKLNEEAIPREARKMGLEVEGKIKQDNGEWWKIRILKERGKMPVEAFGVLPFIPQFIEDKQDDNIE